MPDPDLRVAVQAAEGGMRIELVGELDVATKLSSFNAAPTRSRAPRVTRIDCTELTFADSSGLDTMTRLAKTLGRRTDGSF